MFYFQWWAYQDYLWIPVALFLLFKSPETNLFLLHCVSLVLIADCLWALLGGHGVFLGNTMSYAMGAVTIPFLVAKTASLFK